MANLTKQEYAEMMRLKNKMEGTLTPQRSGGKKAFDPRTYVRKSGAKLTRYSNKDGVERFLVSGWRLNKSKELISIKATTTDKSVESDKGFFGSVAVTFTNTTTGETNFHWGTMEKKTGMVLVDSMAFIMNPRVKNGGYSGTYLGKK